MENFYRLKVSFGKLSFELESHDKDWMEEKEKSLTGNLLSNPKILMQLATMEEPKSGKDITNVGDPSLTINEFYRKFLSNKTVSRLTTSIFLIYYLENYRKMDGVSTSDVKEAFKDINYPKYISFNFADIMLQGKKKGWLNKIDNKWRLTITGKDFVLSSISVE